MKRTITFLLVFVSFALQAQDYIAFNDPNMKAAVLANPDDIDDNNDGEIQFSEAEDFTGTLDLSSSSISDATGLEYFVNITELRINSNSLTTLDLTANDRLTAVFAQYNSLTSINLTGLSDLEDLYIYMNNLSDIDISTNVNLDLIHIQNNNLSHIDFQNNNVLRSVNVHNNNLRTLDLSNAPSLEHLYCNDNNLIGLNLITSGDHNTPSNTLECDNNTDLTCINVKFPTTFTAVVPNVTIPSGASFSDSCDIYIDIPDGNFEQKLIDLGIDTDATLNQVMLKSDAEAATGTLNLDSENIGDLTGINYFTNIEILRAINNNLTEIDVSNLTGLTGLILSNNSISEIDLSNNTALSTLQIANNNLTEIDLTQNTSLHIIELISNNLTGINLYNNSLLEYVYLSNNNLPNLVMANHPNLIRLDCAGNGMSGILLLDSATGLVTLHCENNQLENDDIHLGNMNIQTFIANDNLLSDDLDFSELTNLTTLNIANNVGIIGVDLRNGNNTAITSFNATGCTALQTICVDDATWSTTASGWSVDDTSVYSTCLIEIPDSDFEQALMDLGIDTYLDATSPATPNGYIDASDVVGVTYLPLSNKSISNFTGINSFTDLEALIADNNQVSGIDVSALANLRTLNLRNNQLDSYYVTLPNPSNLRNLYVDNNAEFVGGNHFNNVIMNQNLLEKLTMANNNAEILELTNFPNLLELDCSNNPDIDELDVSASPNLRILRAAGCSLTTLNLSSIHSLDEIRVQNNGMTSLNLGFQPHLNSIRCFANNLTELDVSGISTLGFLACGNNQIVSLDVSNNHQLGYFEASNNTAMLTLNLNNGNNNTTLDEVYATNLGSGCCIQVDDETNIPYTWELDTTDTTITNDCTPNLTYVPDNNFEQALIDLTYDDVLDDYVNTANINSLTSLDIHGKNIEDLTGIEDFTALEILHADNNSIENVDLYSNTALSELYIHGNDLVEIDLSNNTALIKLLIGYNEITELDLSQNTSLTYVSCYGNPYLESFDFRNGNNTNVTIFEARSCPLLSCIFVDNTGYATSNWSGNIDATSNFVETDAECDAILDISSEVLEMGITLYPNPVTSQLNIDVNNNIQLIKVSIFDSMGKLIRVDENTTSISFEHLPSGIYLIKLQDVDGTSIIKKIIKK